MLSELKRQGYSTTTYTFPPGCVFGDHSHGVQKQDAILSGRFLFRMEGEEVSLILAVLKHLVSTCCAEIISPQQKTTGRSVRMPLMSNAGTLGSWRYADCSQGQDTLC